MRVFAPELLRDALFLSVPGSAYIMLVLRWNPRLFLRHYPKEIRAAVAPLTPKERRQSRVAGLPFILLLASLPIWSGFSLAPGGVPPVSPLEAGLHAMLMLMSFNLVDFALLDIFWLCWLQPRWAVMPGATNVVFRANYSDHFRGFLIGSVLSVAIGTITAALVYYF